MRRIPNSRKGFYKFSN